MTACAGPDFRAALPLTRRAARLMLGAVDAEFNSQVHLRSAAAVRAAQPAEHPCPSAAPTRRQNPHFAIHQSMAQNQADE